MNESLAERITQQLESDLQLTDDVRYIVLGALEGETQLEDALTGVPANKPHEPQAAAERSTAPVGAFLQSIEVSGFRGIGKTTKLTLSPTPGLVIVAGRNGSGKSSISEAVELAITGETYRWTAEKAVAWRGAWRNMHQPSPAKIRVELAEEGHGRTSIGVDWADGAPLADRRVWVQRHDKPKEPGLTSLGWADAVDTFRPLLSYEELGNLLEDKPSKLYDRLARILNLEQINDGIKRLADRSKELDVPGTELKRLTQDLKCSARPAYHPRG